MTNNLTLTGTVNPDFAEVESDAGQIVLDPRRARSLCREATILSRRARAVHGAERAYLHASHREPRRARSSSRGRRRSTTLGLLSASDDQSLSSTGHDAIHYNILRAQRDIGGDSRIGVAYTDRVVAGDYNRVADVDGRMLFGKIYTEYVSVRAELRSDARPVSRRSALGGHPRRNGKQFGFRYQLTGIDDDFRAPSGFISRGVDRARRDRPPRHVVQQAR